MKIRRFKAFFLLVPVLIGCLFAPMGTAFAFYQYGNSFSVNGPDSTPMTVDNVVYRSEVSPDGNSQEQVVDVTFSTSISPRLYITRSEATLSNPVYVNGYVSFGLANVFPSASNITNTSLYSFEQSSTSPAEGIEVVTFKTSSLNPIMVYVYFSNFCITSSTYYIDLPVITIRDTVTFSYVQQFDTLVLPNLSQYNMEWAIRAFDASSVAFIIAPDINLGLASIIRDSVVNAINSSSIVDATSLLNSIYQHDVSAYSGVLNYLADLSSDSENIKLYLQANLPDILSKVQDISSEQLRFNNAMYDLIYNYIYSAPSDTAAQSAMANESAAMASAASALEVSKPNIQALVQAPDALINQDVKNSQTAIFAWINHSRILPVMLIVFTLAILSFVLYGKSG